jgi:hypothetical protein
LLHNRGPKTIAELRAGEGFINLEARRGMDYHRRRPQSVEHTSPRREAVVRSESVTSYSYFAEALEPEADADQVRGIVVSCMEAARTAMSDIRRLMPKLIRAEGITYVF